MCIFKRLSKFKIKIVIMDNGYGGYIHIHFNIYILLLHYNFTFNHGDDNTWDWLVCYLEHRHNYLIVHGNNIWNHSYVL